ncbi:MAG TPA: hypothetical protein VFY14_17230, partial [Streptomyces sp.]|nr:hypothetical protein [Streptomyces sp.]
LRNLHEQRIGDAAYEGASPGDPDSFYLDSMDLVDAAVTVALVIAAAGLLVAVAESIVSRRRTLASLVATGVPRPVLGRALAWQTFLPLAPATLLALVVGTLMGRGLFGTEVTAYGGQAQVCTAESAVCAEPGGFEAHSRLVDIPNVVRTASVPLDDLALLGLGTLALVLAATGIGLLFLRAGTAVEELRTG